MCFSIKDKVALITVANRGIGKALVDSFIAQGASKVYLAIRDLDSAAELKRTYGDKVGPVYLDLGKAESITALAEAAPDVDVVVNNAGLLKKRRPVCRRFRRIFP